MKLAIFSDAHIHSWAEHSHDDRGVPSRLRDCVSVLRKVRAYCEDHVVDAALFGGDLFHKRGVLYTQPYNLVVEELVAWRQSGIPLFANVGNHDLADRSGKVHALQALASAELLTTVGEDGWATWEITSARGDVVVSAVAYCPEATELRRRTDAALANRVDKLQGEFTIGLFHHGFKGARVGTSLEYVVKEEADPNEYAKSFDAMFCVDDETEALTPNGWKRHDELKVGSMIACVDKHGKFSWEPIHKMNVGHSPGKLIKFGGGRSHVDHVVTDNHMMWIRGSKRDRMEERRADDVYATPIHKPLVIQTASADWEGKWSWCGPIIQVMTSGFSDDLARLAGWYVAEGSISKDQRQKGSPPRNVSIAKSKAAYPSEYKQILALVRRLGLKPSEHQLMIRICSSELARWMLAEFGDGCERKRLPQWVKEWPRHWLEILVRTMIMGDGHEIHSGLATYDTISKQLADDLQEVCIKLGWSSTLSTRKRKNRKRIYTLTIVRRSRPEREFTHVRTRVSYDGVVWCPTVRTGLWFARRNGRVIVTKNSGHYHAHQEIGSQGNAWYVGSPMEFVRGETSPKGFLVLDTIEAEIERVDLDLPRFVKITGEEIADEDFDVEAHVKGNFVDVVFEELPMPWDKVDGIMRKLGALGVRAVPTKEEKLSKSSRLRVDPTAGDKQLLEAYMEHVGVDPSERDEILRVGLSLIQEAQK